MILLFTPTSPVQEVSFIHPTTPRWRPPRWSLPPAGRPAGMMDSVLGVNLTTRTSWMDEGASLVPLILLRGGIERISRQKKETIICKFSASQPLVIFAMLHFLDARRSYLVATCYIRTKFLVSGRRPEPRRGTMVESFNF